MNNYIYQFGDSLYINLTNRCSNDCSFCIRNNREGMGEGTLWLEREPSAEEVIAAIDARLSLGTQYKEFVFCGFGEPTYKMDELCAVARHLRGKGRVRLNTNGQGKLINGCDVATRIADCIDVVSISLNQCDAAKYNAACHSIYGDSAYDAILELARELVSKNVGVVLSVVNTIPQLDIDKCAKIAQSLGADFRVRPLE